jgi:MobA/MobL family
MASYHIQINTGEKGEALEHAQYIQREGPFTEERYGEVAARGVANMPAWAREDPAAFWKASDAFERANGNTYREYELALSRELSRAEQIALVERFAEQELGTTRAYQWAIHTPMAGDGKEQPHVHLMFSDRQMDGIEREPEQFFKRYNSKHPERGGCQKATYGADKAEAALVYEEIRARWAKAENRALEQAGVEARVDHRSLAAQGIHREPQLHRGPAVSGIEARGEVSEVGERQREQRQERVLEREAVVAEVRVVTREEVALEREAARERRELAQEVTGEAREDVLKRVEADRREQLNRAQAMAERRVERRQGLGLGERLVGQARALRERIGQQLERVKEWVLERFPDPLQQIKEQARDLFEAVTAKVRGVQGLDVDTQEPPGSRRARGRFDGLHLSAGPEEGFSGLQLSGPAMPVQGLDARGDALHQSLDRYARAWVDRERMPEKGLPILPHQVTELKKAGRELDRVRPGASRDLGRALEWEPDMAHAMQTLEGPERSQQLLAGIEREGRIAQDPELGTVRWVKEWNALEAERKTLQGWEHTTERMQVVERAQELTRTLKRDPQLESLMKQRLRELGIEPGSRLAQILNAKDLKRALSLSAREHERDLGLSM